MRSFQHISCELILKNIKQSFELPVQYATLIKPIAKIKFIKYSIFVPTNRTGMV